MPSLKAEIRQVKRALGMAKSERQTEQTLTERTNLFSQYRLNPLAYCREVLGTRLWTKQKQILSALLTPPHKVLVKASHTVGKTFVAACAVNWWYDTRNPGIVLSTAPTREHVKRVLWKEVRLRRHDESEFSSLTELRSAPDHFAAGFTTDKPEAFQGHHGPAVLAVIDEAVGVDPLINDVIKTMAHATLAIFNPTDSTTWPYTEEARGGWHVIQMSALDHPNIEAELRGERPPFPEAVRLAYIEAGVRDWCEPIHPDERESTDLEWPPESGQWHRPGPEFECRVLGRWPSHGTYGVWSDSLWASTQKGQDFNDGAVLPQIGCDVAHFGDDWTAIHVRHGPVSLHHESFNGWTVDKIAGRLKHWAIWCARYINDRREKNSEPIKPEQIRVLVDDDGVGKGVVDLAGNYAFVRVSAASRAQREEFYPNKRSELWFSTAERARRGQLDLSLLDRKSLGQLRLQAMAPTWQMDALGRRVVEPKADTKEKIRRSPDDMDALNLAYYDGGGFLAPSVTIDNIDPHREMERRRQESLERNRGMFGRRERPDRDEDDRW